MESKISVNFCKETIEFFPPKTFWDPRIAISQILTSQILREWVCLSWHNAFESANGRTSRRLVGTLKPWRVEEGWRMEGQSSWVTTVATFNTFGCQKRWLNSKEHHVCQHLTSWQQLKAEVRWSFMFCIPIWVSTSVGRVFALLITLSSDFFFLRILELQNLWL